MKKSLSLIFSFALLLSVLAGCGRKTETEAGNHGDGWLTHVFRGTEISLPEGYSVTLPNAADYDAETGVLRCLAQAPHEVVDQAGNLYYTYSFVRLEVTEEGRHSEEPITVEERTRLQNALYAGNFLYLVDSGQGGPRLRRIDLKTGREDKGIGLKNLFQHGRADSFPPQFMASDADGNIYLYSYHEILVLSPKYEKLCSIAAEDASGMASDGEGRVWVWGSFNGRSGMRQVLADSSGLGEMISLENVQKVLFAPGHDLYVMTDGGIKGGDFTDEGGLTVSEDEIVSFPNSDIELTHTEVISLASPDLFLASEQGSGSSDTQIVLYQHIPDINLAEIKTVHVALSAGDSTADRIRLKTVQFNKNHTDIRIMLDDYTPNDSWVGNDLYTNENRLALGITTGTYHPDLVICFSDGPVFKVGTEQRYFRDLTPFTERKGVLNRDNILGCVKRTYTDGDGRLFGLTDRFTIERGDVMFSTAETLGTYAQKGSCTLEEFLFIAENLPEGVILMDGLTRNNAHEILLGEETCATFIDMESGTCSFDSERFIRVLDYIVSLPTSRDRQESKAALASMRVGELESFVNFEAVFGTKDWVLIGKPTDTGYGTAITARAVFAVLTDTEGDAAWEVLEALMNSSEGSYESGIPALVSGTKPYFDNLKNSVFYIEYGGLGSSVRDKTGEWWNGYNEKPGIETEFTEEDEERLLDLLDNRIGIPYNPAVSADVTAIVNEELSAFLGGVGTAEDCAAKIQSRVSIWLAEHK